MLKENMTNSITLANSQDINKKNILLKTNNTNLNFFFPKTHLNPNSFNKKLEKYKYINLNGKIH